jgi:Raf kinase inhibitor-like YbhB/YbcL family protein
MVRCLAYVLIGALAFYCCQKKTQSDFKTEGGRTMEIKVTSTAFEDGGMIPSQYTCDGKNISPPLSWTSVPKDAKSLAVICDDPDAPMGTWVHWVLFNIPASIHQFPENMSPKETLENGSRHGITDFRRLGYGGPCPPSGTHRYFFKLYALDAMLDLKAGSTKDQLLKAMEGHILAQGQLMGKYKRQ